MKNGTLKLLLHLLGLRYRLLWALARLRNGRIIFFIVGYLVLFPAIAMFVGAGIGASATSVHSGRPELVAGIIFSVCFVMSALAAIVLGIGTSAPFSDKALRRYPLSSSARFFIHHFSAIMDPLWILFLALYAGYMIGLGLFGATSIWIAAPVAVLLTISNYLSARVLWSLIERLIATRTGTLVLLLASAPLFIMPAFALPILHSNSQLSPGTHLILRFTPPFAAAASASSISFSTFGWVLLLFTWCAALAAALYLIDRIPFRSKPIADADTTWDSVSDRVADLFGAGLAPLVGKMLRYYIRSPQTRYNYPIAMVFILTAVFDPPRSFLLALGIISVVGSISMGAMTMNVFGFDGPGFRRYFLLPIRPVKVLLASAIVPLLLGTAIVLTASAIWISFTTIHFDAQMIVMLLSCGFSGIFIFQALGLWTSLFTPLALPFNITFGRRLPISANALIFISIAIWFGLPFALEKLGIQTVLDHWWVAPFLLAFTLSFYIATLWLGAAAFSKRRETMLSAIERGL